MSAAVKLRTDYSAVDLRRLAAGSRHANQSRRLLSLAAVLDGMDRDQAARIGGMDRQTLRDWVHRFNQFGPDGLTDGHRAGRKQRLDEAAGGGTCWRLRQMRACTIARTPSLSGLASRQ